jgi:hypothetical protein
MPDGPSFPSPEELERQHGIPPDRFCGLTAEAMSRAIVAYECGPRKPGEPVGYWPAASADTRQAWLAEALGPDADAKKILLRVQFFLARAGEALKVDWMLDNAEFDRAIWDGLAALYPDLSADARSAIAGNYSYSHMK